MKRLSILLLSALCTAATTFAYDFQSGDLYYNITSKNTVEVTMSLYYVWEILNYEGLTTATIPSTVTYDGIIYSVTSIGNSAFSGCSSLTSVSIPNSVTSIGNSAFSGCSSLTSFAISKSITRIGSGVFAGCSSITSIIVESGNTVYDSRENCNAIIEAETNTLIAGCQSTTIPNSVTSIGSRAFSGCSSLISITIPNSVTSIGERAFAYCSSLTSITIPNSVTSIGDYAFYECSSLTSITIPNSVTSIGGYAFSGCSSLNSLTIPNSVTSIGDYAFDNIPNVVYNGTATGSPWGARSVNGYVDGYLLYADETKTTLLACSVAATGEITLPNSVVSIGDYAFLDCSSLTSITIPNSVTSMGVGAFVLCSSSPPSPSPTP